MFIAVFAYFSASSKDKLHTGNLYFFCSICTCFYGYDTSNLVKNTWLRLNFEEKKRSEEQEEILIGTWEVTEWKINGEGMGSKMTRRGR